MSVQAMAWAWGAEGLTTTEKFVLVCLADHADHDGVCWPGQDRVAEKTGLGERTVRRAVQSLIEKEQLSGQRRRRVDGTLSGYVYTLKLPQPNPQVEVESPPATLASGPPANDDSTTGHSGRSITVKENHHSCSTSNPSEGTSVCRALTPREGADTPTPLDERKAA